MELCSSAPSTSFYFKSLVVSFPISSISLPFSFKPTKRFNSLTISHQLSHSSRNLSICVRASTASEVNDVVKDPLPADLLVEEIQEPNCRIRLSVEVPRIVCDDCYKMIINEFRKWAKVPGIPPEIEVPEDIIISYIGIDGVRKATVESILKKTLPHAMSSVCSFSCLILF